VDPRGAGELADDPAGSCDRLAKRVGLPLTNISRASAHTELRLAELQRILTRERLAPGISVCVFGSWARGELTPGSDDDWAVLTLDPPVGEQQTAVDEAMAAAGRHLGAGIHAPGSQDIFGCAFDADTLASKIGLHEDTNQNLTRRLLLLLESRAIAGDVHEIGWSRVLERYLNYGVKDYHVPRFLLNDLVRYWRTICVDFEGKHREGGGEDPKWVSRNAKLKTSRKLLFAGGLIPIMLCDLKDTDQMPGFLTSWLKARPLDRLAAAFDWADMQSEAVRTLDAYDRWLAIQLDEDARAHLRSLSESTRHDSPLYIEIREIGERFQRGLEALLFDSPLAPLARKFLIF
jgi:Nucleotidyltransferase domain